MTNSQTNTNSYPCWLDKYINEQAKYYGLTIDQYAKLMNGAAIYDDLILTGKVEEPTNVLTCT